MAPRRRLTGSALLAFLLVVSQWSTQAQDKPPAKPPAQGSARCAECHEDDMKEWRDSPHARAMGADFQAVWQKEGQKWECLICHTSHYDRKAGTYSHEGVGCESCHGDFKQDHPDKQKMVLPVTSAACQPCHSITYGEWRVSSHGQKNIRCFDCHKMHQMNLRKDDPDVMCGTCHTERLQGYSHATHHLKGVKCIACHMPQVMGTHTKIKGTGTRGHSFGVGAETCSGCHKEMVHARSDRVDLEHEVERLKKLNAEPLQQQIESQRQELDSLRQSLHASRRVFAVVVAVAFCLGAVLMYAVLHRRPRKPGPP
jgi:hypothetical protein